MSGPTKAQVHFAQKFGKKYGIRPSDLLDVIQHESNFDPLATEHFGTVSHTPSESQGGGLTQFIPSTAKQYGVQYGASRHAQKTQIRGEAHLLHDSGWGQGSPAEIQKALAAYYGAPSPYASDVISSNAYAKYDKGKIKGGKKKGGKGKTTTTTGTTTKIKLKGPLTPGQKKFGSVLAKKTGLSPKVIGAWMLAEENSGAAQSYENRGYFNWLNIGPNMQNKAFSNPKSAAKATAKFIEGKNGPLGPAGANIPSIAKTADQSDQAQMQAILNSGWGTQNIQGTYGQVTAKVKEVPGTTSTTTIQNGKKIVTAPGVDNSAARAQAALAFINTPDKSFTDYLNFEATKQSLADIPAQTKTVSTVQSKPDGFGPMDSTSKSGSSSVSAKPITRIANKLIGTQEGTKSWAGSSSLPWCSLFVNHVLTKAGYTNLPTDAAYSGAWLSWSGAKKVSLKNIQPGDIVVFDWGDGGRTDHVAIYNGNGTVIGGNQSNAVTKVPLNKSAIVGIVRPVGSSSSKSKSHKNK